MSRGKRRKCAPFIRLEHRLFDSLAFADLRPSSAEVYLSILRRHNGINGDKSDPIICPYRAMKGSSSPATIKKALDELEAHGFIAVVQRGGMYKQPNSYALLKDWQHWKPKGQKPTCYAKRLAHLSSEKNPQLHKMNLLDVSRMFHNFIK